MKQEGWVECGPHAPWERTWQDLSVGGCEDVALE